MTSPVGSRIPDGYQRGRSMSPVGRVDIALPSAVSTVVTRASLVER